MNGRFYVAPDPDVAVLVVHGVGRQKIGETVKGFCEGLKTVYGDDISVEQLHPRDIGSRLVHGLGRTVAVIEVYWADLLEGELVKGTFRLDEVFELVWFPMLNLLDGSLPASMRARVRSWTRKLVPLGPLAFAGMYALDLIAIFWTGVVMIFQPHKADDRAAARRSQSRSERMSGLLHVNNWFDNMVDDVAGDVLNYVRGAENAFSTQHEAERQPFGTPITPERAALLRGNVNEIHERFNGAAEQAVQLGCREIQVVAHSLGTVVAWRAMTRSDSSIEPATIANGAPARITRFFTIGSPLNKIRFFWPRIVALVPERPSITDRCGRVIATTDPEMSLKWLNLYSNRDPVSGDVERFEGWPEPESKEVEGLGGVITAHTAYLSNTEFMSIAGAELFGEPPTTSAPAGFWKRLRHRGQSWVLPLVLIALVGLGFAVILGFGLLVGWLLAQLATWVGLGALANALMIAMVVSTFFGLTVAQVIRGRRRASDVHRRYWASTRAEQ